MRDFLTEDVERIVVDSPTACDRMRNMIARISRRSVGKVKLYTDSQPIFDRFGISKQLETTFSRQVQLKSGGYIVVDETEALVAIDVNTGRHKGGKDQDSTIFKVNLEAADEICRQLRLRNMGGLIVLDFIDMKSRRDQQTVYQRMKEGLKRDRAKTHILPLSQLGLMEMTRQRHSESVGQACTSNVHDRPGYGRRIVMAAAVERIVVQASAKEKKAIAAKAKRLGLPISELMRRGASAYESAETDEELGALADAARDAAERACASIDDALAFIEVQQPVHRGIGGGSEQSRRGDGLMGVTDRVWAALTAMIKLEDKVTRQAEALKSQQSKIEDLTSRVIRLEAQLEPLTRAAVARKLKPD